MQVIVPHVERMKRVSLVDPADPPAFAASVVTTVLCPVVTTAWRRRQGPHIQIPGNMVPRDLSRGM